MAKGQEWVDGKRQINIPKVREEYGLTENQIRFCEKYIEHGNATQAYFDVYKSKSKDIAGKQASRLMQQEKIQRYIKDVMDEISADYTEEAGNVEKLIAGSDEILITLTNIIRQYMKEEVVGFTQKGQVVKTEKSPSIKDVLKACELLGKRSGMWKEVVDINNAPPITIQFEEAEQEEIEEDNNEE